MSDLIERQAAIDAVGYYSLHSGDKLLFADKPLKELPSAQPKPCEDAVSRTDVFNAVRGEERGGYVDETVGYMLKVMSDLPPVTPERKTGKWIWEIDERDPSRSRMLVCSICGSRRDEVGTYNFCNICGAKMEEE